ncbi:hypothetical protein BC940DRAFT_258464 [Gongronella butleri]|nr:hypothetical protein BC940DRAFT_258464 [Gongronella butleri]
MPTTADRYQEATALTTNRPLPTETALPGRRKRSKSLIPPELLNNNSGEGVMERAALATVFGVREYTTEPKVLWERQLTTTPARADDNNQSEEKADHFYERAAQQQQQQQQPSEKDNGYVSITGRTSVRRPLASSSLSFSSRQQGAHDAASLHSSLGAGITAKPASSSAGIETYVDSVLGPVGQQQYSTTMPREQATTAFELPGIPMVSEFDDWLSSPIDLTLYPIATTTRAAIGVMMPSSAHTVSSSLHSPTSPTSPSTSSTKHAENNQLGGRCDVGPPLVFHEYPPAIFDLLKSDTDDRIILWTYERPPLVQAGSSASSPPPLASSYASNSSTSAHGVTPFSTNTTPATYHSTPNVQRTNFFANATAASSATYTVSEKSPKSLPRLLSKLKRNGSNNKKQEMDRPDRAASPILLRFTRRRRSVPQPMTNPAPIVSSTAFVRGPKVIEAATVEKLVEKLTITLDYTFMTDFFLTFRIFLSPLQLCKLLILRFRWGLESNEDERCIVRIRTFVVLRHWLLNYFVHDFTPSRHLREILTTFLNDLPAHELIRHSPRDQRIVKGLKRVVRRLKKVHYPHGSAHVQVISPPPPTYEEERMQLKVRAKLSQSPLRRKTEQWIQKGMAVEGGHHGTNLAIQDARVAPVLLIGSSPSAADNRAPLDDASFAYAAPPQQHVSAPTLAADETEPLHAENAMITLPPAPLTPPPTELTSRHRNMSQNSVISRYASNLSMGRQQQQERAKVKESYLRRMEQQRRMMMEEDEFKTEHSLSTVASDDSLDSLVSPGTTDDEQSMYETSSGDEEDDDDDEDDASDSSDIESPPGEADEAAQQIQPRRTMEGGDQPQRRSVYNADLRALTPMASPSPSMVQGMASLTGGLDASQRDNDTKHLVTGYGPEAHRTSKVEALDTKMSAYDDEKAMMTATPHVTNSPTSLSPPASPQEKQKQQQQQNNHAMAVSSQVYAKPQRKLSQRLAKVFRSASQRKTTTTTSRATVVQPNLTLSNAPSGQMSPQTQEKPRPHVYSEKEEVIPDEKEELSSEKEEVVALPVAEDPPQSQPSRARTMSNLDDLRTSLEEILPPPGLAKPDSAQHTDIHAHHRAQAIVELDLPAWNPNEASPPLHALFRHSVVLRHSSDSLAQQLCLVEQFILRQVNWEEMVHCRWTKMSNDSLMNDGDFYPGHPNYDAASTTAANAGDDDDLIDALHRTYFSRQTRQLQLLRGEEEGGVQQVIKRFNTVCIWVTSEIVRTPRLDERVQVIEKFIRLAQKCQAYSNFATLVQILLGLQSPSVSRLRKTWAKVGDAEMRLLDELSEFTSPIKNWKHIRDNMTLVADEYGMSPTEVQVQLPGAADRHLQKPKIKLPFGGCIPFLGLYLSDLVFNSEQPSYLEPSHEHHKIYQSYTQSSTISPLLCQPLVNFRKYRIIATIIKRVLTFQTLAERYSFDYIRPLYEACYHLDVLDTDTIRQLSLDIEPPPLTA